jgi:hypothetical protein
MSDAHGAVSLTLDLRNLSVIPRSAADFLGLWTRFAPQLVGVTLEPNQRLELSDARGGSLGLCVMQLPRGFSIVETNTPFAIHSVLEPLEIGPGCRVCAGEKRRAHAPFACFVCGDPERAASASEAASQPPSPQVCAAHVVILEGSRRCFCPAHAPRCECGTAALGFCFGPLCGKVGRAFCGPHLRQHPNVADLYFCWACYAELYPPCLEPDCTSVATIRCSHWDRNTERACNRAYCANHARRWQVYGPHRIGLGRCEEHGDLSRLSDYELIFQIGAGALVEKRKPVNDDFDGRLPSLQAVVHILMRPRGVRYELEAINQLFEHVRVSLDPSRPLQSKMLDLFDSHRAFRQQNLARDAEEKEKGRPYFEQLVAVLRSQGSSDLADDLRFADFRPSDQVLFVRLRDDLRGLFVGRGGRRVRELEGIVGVRIQFERGNS